MPRFFKTNAEIEIVDLSQNWSELNDFYIFGDVDTTFARDIIVPFITQVNKLEKSRSTKKELNIYVTSNGGFIHYAFDLINHIEYAKQRGIIVNTYVTSQALSAGSLIAVTGTNRYIGERAFHLLHFMRGWSYSHNPEMSKRNSDNDAFWQEKLVDIYKRYTKIKDIKRKLIADNFMVNGADKCIEAGLADFKF